MALLPSPPTAAAVAASASTAGPGMLDWSINYSRGRGKGYWRGRGGQGRGGGGEYGGHHGANHRGCGVSRSTERGGHSVWGRPAPYPTSVMFTDTVFNFTQWGEFGVASNIPVYSQ